MKTIDFDDTETAFELKSNIELKRAYFLFKIISYPFLVTLGKLIVSVSIKFRLPVDLLIKKTVFDHFCAGIDDSDSIRVVSLLASKNVKKVNIFSRLLKSLNYLIWGCLLYTSPSPRDRTTSRMPSSA